jgi:hypothetical protein
MRNIHTIHLIGLALLLPASASAESLSGTITNIDSAGQKVTIVRHDTNERVDVSISDRNSLARFRNGSSVTLDASRSGAGWEADSITAADASASPAGALTSTESRTLDSGLRETQPSAESRIGGTARGNEVISPSTATPDRNAFSSVPAGSPTGVLSPPGSGSLGTPIGSLSSPNTGAAGSSAATGNTASGLNNSGSIRGTGASSGGSAGTGSTAGTGASSGGSSR